RSRGNASPRRRRREARRPRRARPGRVERAAATSGGRSLRERFRMREDQHPAAELTPPARQMPPWARTLLGGVLTLGFVSAATMLATHHVDSANAKRATHAEASTTTTTTLAPTTTTTAAPFTPIPAPA